MAFDAQFLRERLDYDPSSGVFTWRISPNGRVQAGSAAGTRRKSGHIGIMLDKRGYQAHRLAWLYITGEWPKGQIDHRDLNPANNAWLNLRLSNYFGNAQNRHKYRNNTSGFKGVSRLPSGNFQANITANGKRSYLGAFPTAEAAHAAYRAAAEKHCGEFGRVS